MNTNLTEKEIDDLVIAGADDEDAWETPILVNRRKAFSLITPQPDEVVSEKGVLHGEPIFRGTRVPVSALLDNLEAGVSLDEFLENFPTVTRQQAIQVLEYFKSLLNEFEKAA